MADRGQATSHEGHIDANPPARRRFGVGLFLAVSIAWLLGLVAAARGSHGCAVALAFAGADPRIAADVDADAVAPELRERRARADAGGRR